MRTSAFVLLVAAVANAQAIDSAANAQAIDSAAKGPLEGYTIVPASWEIEVAPGRVETLKGTVQEVVAQAHALNPNFVLPPAVKSRGLSEAPLSRVKRALQKRGNVGTCWDKDRWWWAEVVRVEEGIAYLRQLGGTLTMGAGPAVCSRISCSYNTAIMLCNDNNHPFTINSGWNGVADSAQQILNYCGGLIDNNACVWTSGQNFERDNWNTILTGKERC